MRQFFVEGFVSCEGLTKVSLTKFLKIIVTS